MTLFEIVLKVTHDCPFCNISKKFPSLKMFIWCNTEHDLMEIILDKWEQYSAVIEEVNKIGGNIEKSSDQNKVHLFTKKCNCTLENSISRNIEAFNLLHIAPVIYEQGWEYYRIIGFRHKDLQRLMQKLEDKGIVFEILRKVPFNGFIASSLTLTADTLFSDLTDKQMEALLTAYNYGYYRLPRKANVKAIADRKRIPRTTFQEHLKKAENKLVASLVPYVQLFKHVSPERRESLKIR